MKVYVAHSKLIDYVHDLYAPIRNDRDLAEYEIILPHEKDELSSNTRDTYRNIDVMIAECSEAATGLGIELGWAVDDETPVYVIHRKGKKISGSIYCVTKDIFEYKNQDEMLAIIKTILKKEHKKKAKRQYCASSYVIDFENGRTLLMYNKKLNKWLQPGGHIEGFETPIEACTREALEETGINIKVIGPSFISGEYEPIAVKRYVNNVGDMIDIQYLSVPLNTDISSSEMCDVRWFDLGTLVDREDVDYEIKCKVLSLYQKYK